MFYVRNLLIEKKMHEHGAMHNVLQKFPPIYAEDFTDNVTGRYTFSIK